MISSKAKLETPAGMNFGCCYAKELLWSLTWLRIELYHDSEGNTAGSFLRAAWGTLEALLQRHMRYVQANHACGGCVSFDPKSTAARKRKDSLYEMLNKIPVKGEVILPSENARNRALKFARENRRMFITRQTAKGILLWRQS